MLAPKQSCSSHWSSRTAYLIIVALVAMWSIPVCSLAQEQQPVSQYSHRSWLVRDGLFNGAPPNAITQTTDGYIRIGTNSGLFRFDGSLFQPRSSPDRKKLPSNVVLALLGARDGSLWIGMAWGFAILLITSFSCIPIFMSTWAP